MQYRFVNFGTRFESCSGRRSIDDESEPGKLFENELATDVGGCCWGVDGCDVAVLDHHFGREGQFPSASATVLHAAARIRERFAADEFGNFWLVTHRDPDFDAYCSMYLARNIIFSEGEPGNWIERGLHPTAWRNIRRGELGSERQILRINWFDPDLKGLSGEARWQILLAAFASCVDQAVHIQAPAELTLQSVLYAALRRGRPYYDRNNGAIEFFEAAKKAIVEHKLNPLLDGVLSPSGEFAPELNLLSRELAAYARDVQRARKAIVSVPVKPQGVSFLQFYEEVSSSALLDEHGNLLSNQQSKGSDFRQFDGIYLRDPESLLFKEWARQDNVNSSSRNGFTFTAVTYSREKAGSLRNEAGYYFALAPERAGGCHLYFVWAKLQQAEIREIRENEINAALRARLEQEERSNGERYRQLQKRLDDGDNNVASELDRVRPTRCRPGFEKRAAAYAAYFDDPWFDGVNFECTIVPSPSRGSLLAPGVRPDLTDDAAATIVRHELEGLVYGAGEKFCDYPASASVFESRRYNLQLPPARATVPPVVEGYLRFGAIPLRGVALIERGAFANQIARDLWVLIGGAQDSLPDNFMAEHVMVANEMIGVWSRRGIFVAYLPNASDKVAALKEKFRNMAELSRALESALSDARTDVADKPAVEHVMPERADSLVQNAENLLLKIAKFEHDLVRPESELLRKMLAAIGLRNVLSTVRDLYSATVERRQRQGTTTEIGALRQTQEKIEWIEVLIVTMYSTEIVHITVDLLGGGEMAKARFVLVIAGAFGLLAFRGLISAKRGRPEHVGERPNAALKAIPILLAILLSGLLAATFLPGHYLSFLSRHERSGPAAQVSNPASKTNQVSGGTLRQSMPGPKTVPGQSGKASPK